MTQSHVFSDFFEPTTLAIYFLAAPIGAILLYCIVPHFTTFKPLSKYPGPFWAGYTRLWLAKQARVGKRSEIVHQEHLKHGQFRCFAGFPFATFRSCLLYTNADPPLCHVIGKFVRIGPNEVSIADPAALPIVCKRIPTLSPDFRRPNASSIASMSFY